MMKVIQVFVFLFACKVICISADRYLTGNCGTPVIGIRLINNGENYHRGQLPWMAAIFEKRHYESKFICGGTIISNKHVLSAAHCFDNNNASIISVFLGAHNLSDTSEHGRIIMKPWKIIQHDEWKLHGEKFDADIAMLIMRTKFPFSEYIQPMCVWQSDHEPAVKTGYTAGWGQSEDKTRYHEIIPKMLKNIPIHSQEHCFLKYYLLARISSERTFCAGKADGSGPCTGDSGSGFFISEGSTNYLRGIVSSSLINIDGSCVLEKYVIYTNVLKFQDWIVNFLKSSVDPDEYVQPENKHDTFDWQLSQTILRDARDKNKNIIFSPLSIKLLLTLLAEASGDTIKSKTRSELEQVLPYNKSLCGLCDAKDYFKLVLSSLSMKSDDYKLNIGTKVYIAEGVKINQRFEAIAESSYLADVGNLNFVDSRGSANAINSWVKTTTNGRIADLVSEDSVNNSIMLLINALYFEGTWRFGFNKTFTGGFTTTQGKRVKKPFMERTGNYYYYYSKHLDAKLLKIPYNGRRYSMLIILPNDNQNLDSVVSRLDASAIKNEVWHMDEVEVHVTLPKFKFDSSMNLNEVVQKLGIREIFETTATFPLIARGGTSDGKLKVSNIIQKSGLVVDEKGKMRNEMLFESEPKEFVVDRPFLFCIEDDTTGAKVFIGRINNPEY